MHGGHRTVENEKRCEGMNKMGYVTIFLMVLAAYALWNTPVLYPVKLFVVVLHEMSHGLAALLCGGRILEIQIDPRIGGLCRFAIPPGTVRSIFVASAGYLGSIFWGALILILGARTRYDRYVALAIGVIVLLLTLFFIRLPFGIMFCLLFSALMFCAFRFLPDWANDMLIKFLGMASCLYAIVDIKEDLIDRSGIGSDADRIAQLLGMPGLSVVIGILWIFFALAVVLISLKVAGGGGDEKKGAGSDEDEEGDRVKG
jgi:hypothetical protein